MIFLLSVIYIGALTTVSSLNVAPSESLRSAYANTGETSRANFLQVACATGVAVVLPADGAYARGRATLDYAYERYVPRIIDGGEFFKKDFVAMIGKSDWNGIKSSLAEPPKKAKSDRSKADGGVAERAAQAGKFSNARVLVACDLFASAFSDSSISQKTKDMQKEVNELRQVIVEMDLVARQALGEETSGGFFGIGSKKSSKEELSKSMKQLYLQGGQAWNRYIFAANDGLPVQLNKLPYL
eukprot:CAMPEP_0113619886 /NCGR_PEP_ID=MMETSP0017_2-20120614/10113_1 /TAXON_ID=2856 /ORGANISM="Cylindrotheca closterium" /LENGTH=241 /DNA_ID=CAMNT_0000529499 /DNA_START=71 /DNA_END=796 /DNA_ORIENTATION=+ /assembly_acc=CAM_ASM_000147